MVRGFYLAGLTVILAAGILSAPLVFSQQSIPVYVADPLPPTAGAACSGSRVWLTDTNPSIAWCCIGKVWTRCAEMPAAACGANSYLTQTSGGAVCQSLGGSSVAPVCPSGQFLTSDGGMLCAPASITGGACEESVPNNFVVSIGTNGAPMCGGGITETVSSVSATGFVAASIAAGVLSLDLAVGMCGNGQVLMFDADGQQWYCSDPVPLDPFSCPAGSMVDAYNDETGWHCSAPPDMDGGAYVLPIVGNNTLGGVQGSGTSLTCPAGEYAVGFSADSGVLLCRAEEIAAPPPLCAEGEFVTSDGGGFLCKRPFVSQDMSLCPLNYVSKRTDAGVVCVDSIAAAGYATTAGSADYAASAATAGTATGATAALCAAGYVLTSTDAGFTCVYDGIGTVTNGKLCLGVDGGIDCTQDLAFGGTMTAGHMCTAVATGAGYQAACAQHGIPQTCAFGNAPMSTGSGNVWACQGTAMVASDQTGRTTAWTEITGLSATTGTVVDGIGYVIGVDCQINYSVSNTALGIALGLYGPTSSSVTYQTGVFHNAVMNVANHGTEDWCNSNSQAAGDGGCSATTTTTTWGADVYGAHIKGVAIIAGNAGTLKAMVHGSNSDYEWTIRAGSWCKFDYIR